MAGVPPVPSPPDTEWPGRTGNQRHLGTTGRPSSTSLIPANTGRPPDVGLLLGQRRRRWPNIIPTLGMSPVFSGMHSGSVQHGEGNVASMLARSRAMSKTLTHQ